MNDIERLITMDISELEQELKQEEEEKLIANLRTWKEELEKEIEEIRSILNGYRNERVVLQTKVTILSDILRMRKDSIDDVKIAINYDAIDGRLKELQSQEQGELEKKLASKILYNKLTVLRINSDLS